MKKTTITIFAALSLISTLAISQSDEVNVYWGKQNTLNKSASVYLLGKRGNDILGYEKIGKDVNIVKFSYDDLATGGEATIIGKGDNVISRDYVFNKMLFLKDKVYVCVTQFNKSSKENVLYMEEFNFSGELVGGLKKVGVIPGKSKSNSGWFDIIESKDSTKFLMVNVPPFEKYSGEKFSFQVLDENLNQLDDAQVSLPNNFKYFIVPSDGISLSNDGIVYMLAKNIEQKGDKTKGEAGYFYQLLAINPQGSGDVTTYDLKLPEKAITDISYSVEDTASIICSGFYGNVKNSKYSTGEIDGIFYFRINKSTKQIESTGLKALDHDFIADITSQKNADKGKGISNNFELTNFIRRSDGGSMLVSEYRYTYVVTTVQSDGHGGMYTVDQYHYVRNNILVVNINPDGSIKWYTNIPKQQHTVDDGGVYSSFVLGTHGNKMYFVYNDNTANMQPGAEEHHMKTMTNPSKSTAVVVELSESGQFSKSGLFNSKDNKAVIEPEEALKINDGEFILPAVSGKTSCCLSGSSNKYTLVRFDFK